MCGIAGYYMGACGLPSRPQLLGAMLDTIKHRGPDGQGVLIDENTGLGHVRLSIIDLSGGGQPMVDHTNTVWVTFNGEIFNYVELRAELVRAGHHFNTSSDTEIILESYKRNGTQCVTDFNGDFAFGLWDRSSRRLMLARDRLGVRPIYYTVQDDILYFASEVKALFTIPGVRPELDPVALAQVFTFWHPLAPRTPWKGISELPPGHMLIASDGRIEVRSYWTHNYPQQSDEYDSRPEAELADELRELLLDATRIRLRADVPVGAYLSGGLDSAITATLIKLVAPGRLRTFSVGFESAEFDESKYQQEMVRALGCDHTNIVMSNDNIASNFPDVMYHTERPILRTAPVPLYSLAKLVQQSHYKVVLTGEGADEVFGGYDIFKEAKVRRFWARNPQSAWRASLLQRLYPYIPGLVGQSTARLRSFFGAGLDTPNDSFFSHRPRWSTTSGTMQLLSTDLCATINGYDPIDDLFSTLPPEYANWSSLSQAQYLEISQLLPGYILSSQGDRMAMAHGVEGRFPFLDHRVAEFAAKLPSRLKLRGLIEKYLLRSSVRQDLPSSIAWRPKQPYRAPDAQCFCGPETPDYVHELLSPTAITASGYFDAGSVTKLLRKCSAGGNISARNNMALVGILSVQLLDYLFIDSSSRTAVPNCASRDIILY